ncbi:hypothetical protein SAMN05421678_103293 [Actinopolymorpha cephalotaxi]|uniref:Uncharacterized protein n=1 Tax=Actinopolymorpha cephalotaxi TaxID=504797 RepID=A0A1I2NIL1_9ACTN|nr:hypothetical protein [Actinopolymorpha cephalotaxi]NYH85599.1 hypothetical protein [Actinopolymorpha cephalotaxi]SFG01131.1 hypothetical protein SAMN05421678_103293 [Actinopolymorpha cephalotaxi]
MSESPQDPAPGSDSPDPTQRLRARLGAVLDLASAQLPPSAAPDFRTPTSRGPAARTPVGVPPTERRWEDQPGAPGAPAPGAPAPGAPAPGAPAAPERAPGGNGSTTPLITAAVGASVRVRASEPNDLGVAHRADLARLFQRVGAWALGLSAAGMFLAALAAFRWIGGENVDVGAVGWAAVGLALVSLTSLVLAYFTVMGFRQIEYEADLGGGEHGVSRQGSSQGEQGRGEQSHDRAESGDGRRPWGG